MGYLVQRQLKSYTISGKLKPAESRDWQTVSGYDSKASAQKEVSQVRGANKNYRYRVIADKPWTHR